MTSTLFVFCVIAAVSNSKPASGAPIDPASILNSPWWNAVPGFEIVSGVREAFRIAYANAQAVAELAELQLNNVTGTNPVTIHLEKRDLRPKRFVANLLDYVFEVLGFPENATRLVPRLRREASLDRPEMNSVVNGTDFRTKRFVSNLLYLIFDVANPWGTTHQIDRVRRELPREPVPVPATEEPYRPIRISADLLQQVAKTAAVIQDLLHPRILQDGADQARETARAVLEEHLADLGLAETLDILPRNTTQLLVNATLEYVAQTNQEVTTFAGFTIVLTVVLSVFLIGGIIVHFVNVPSLKTPDSPPIELREIPASVESTFLRWSLTSLYPEEPQPVVDIIG